MTFSDGVQTSTCIFDSGPDIPLSTVIRLVGPKLHGIRVTECQLNYHGSITIDQDIMAKAGFLPLEFVNVWNKTTGSRISTYILPGTSHSGICCLNGGAARSCQIDDELIITSERTITYEELRKNNYKTRVLTFDSKNNIEDIMTYELRVAGKSYSFYLFPED